MSAQSYIGDRIPRKYQYWLSKESVWGWLFLIPTLLAIALVSLYPVFHGIMLSFYDHQTLQPNVWVGLDNYVTVLGWSELWLVLRNSIIWSFVSLVFAAGIGLGFAHLLNRDFRGRSIATVLLLMPWAVPFIGVALNWNLMYSYELGMVNGLLEIFGFQSVDWLGNSYYALFAVAITYTWRNFPFFMITFLAAMRGIPQDLYEAAEVDGSSRFDQFRHITLPYLRPIAIVVTLLQSIWTLNHFTLIYVLTGGGPGNSSMVLPVYIYQRAFLHGDFGLASTIAVILMLIMLSYGLIYIRFYNQVGDK